jgi:membrane protease YdiL (CAAX protease family)
VLPPTPRPPRLSRVGVLVLLYAGLTAVAVGWGALRGQPNIYVLPGRAHPSLLGFGVGPLAGIAFALFVVFLTRWSVHRLQWARTLHQEFRHLLGPLSGGEIFLIAAASSVGEEFLFRGAMMPALGVWLSSALFALPHIGPKARFLPWTITSFAMGLALSGLFVWSGDLGAPVAAHFTVNLLNLQYISRHEL